MASLALSLILLSACAPKEAKAPEAPPSPTLATEVRTVRAQSGILEREVRASATLQAEKDSLVAAGASGRVLRTLPAGTRVQAGEGVVYLDPAPFQEALEAARLNLKQAEANLERARNQLAGNRATLKAQLQAAEAQLQAAKKRYEEGQALLSAGALAPLDLKALEAQYPKRKATTRTPSRPYPAWSGERTSGFLSFRWRPPGSRCARRKGTSRKTRCGPPSPGRWWRSS